MQDKDTRTQYATRCGSIFTRERSAYIEKRYKELLPSDKAIVDNVTEYLIDAKRGFRNLGTQGAHELIFQTLSWKMETEIELEKRK